MQDISTKHLLYIQTATSNHLETKCVFLYHEYNLEFPITKAIPYYAKLHFTSASILIDAAKAYSTLTSWCLFTLIQNDSFPNKTKRAPIQTYINAHYIIGMTEMGNSTMLHFKNGKTLEVDEPMSLISKNAMKV